MSTVGSQCRYDSDFSEDSTIPSSESEEEPLYPISKIPTFCLYPPEIPDGRFIWNCPNCDYNIDFLNLSTDIVNQLPDDTKLLLDSKTWTIKDEPIQFLFLTLASEHYKDHLPADIRSAMSPSV